MVKKLHYYPQLVVGSVMKDVRLLDHEFDFAELLRTFSLENKAAGGIASFTGQVRPDGDVSMLELSHYEPLTLPGMDALADQACGRFDLDGVLVLHRIGRMAPGDPIVLVAAASAHRRGALQAVDYLMDHLKSAAWFWKRELREDGWHWIEPRTQDYTDRSRWE